MSVLEVVTKQWTLSTVAASESEQPVGIRYFTFHRDTKS